MKGRTPRFRRRACGRQRAHRRAIRSPRGPGSCCTECPARDGVEPAVILNRVTDQLGCVAVDLVQVRAVGREPVVARAAADGPVERPERAVSRDLGARRVLGDREHVALDAVGGDVAVAEVGREHSAVIGADRQPAQLRRQTRARVDLDDRPGRHLAVRVERRERQAIGDGIADDELVWAVVQEQREPRRGAAAILEQRLAERASPFTGNTTRPSGSGALDATECGASPLCETQRIGEPSGFGSPAHRRWSRRSGTWRRATARPSSRHGWACPEG